MARTKLQRITKANELPNVFSLKTPDLNDTLKSYFKSDLPITLEVGCGHGDYSVELAKKFPQRNFIGIDIKGARIFSGAMKALNLNLNNVAFIQARVEKLIEIFHKKSIEEIYIPFPDPHTRRTSQKRRLISPFFLDIYKQLLIDSGLLHFKTDDENLFHFAVKSISDSGCKIIHSTENLYGDIEVLIDSEIITSYERHYINEGRKIKYICFMF